MNKFEVTFTVDGFIKVFKDVVECDDIEDVKKEIEKLVVEAFGKKLSVSISLIRSI